MLGGFLTVQEEHAPAVGRVVRHVASPVADDVLVSFHHHERKLVLLVAAGRTRVQEGFAQGDEPRRMGVGKGAAVEEPGPFTRQHVIEGMGGSGLHAGASVKYRGAPFCGLESGTAGAQGTGRSKWWRGAGGSPYLKRRRS